MTAAEAVIHLRKENQELREALKQTQELRQVALARIEELENQQTPPPALVKADVKKPAAEEKQPRKKRAAQHKHARRRAVPTQMVEHHRVCCPDCDLRVGAVRVVRRRDVIDLPAPIAMHIPEHRIFKGGWARCQTWHEAPVDLSA